MNLNTTCRCCLARPPDKDLKSVYTCLGKTEVYGDMLKECFEIHLSIEPRDSENGICEICIVRLRDACDFKHQVLRCQKEFQIKLTTSIEDIPKIKDEYSDNEENDIFFLDLKDHYEDLKEDDKLAEILNLDDVSVERKVDKKKNGKKRQIIIEKPTKDRKSKNLKSSIKLSLRTLSQIERLNKSPSIRFISENKKHSINTEKILKYSNCTPFFNKTIAGIVCAYCKETYQTLEELRLHTQDIHKRDDLSYTKRLDKSNLSLKMDITDLKCNICEKNFDVISNLKTHLIKEHDIKFFPDVNDYIMEFKLTDAELLNCALCHSTFETFKMLLQHMNGHYRNYICDVCDMGFINKHRLKNHQRIHDIGTFKCEFCEKIFSTRVKKMCHEKYTHNSASRYTTNCPHCDQSFNSYYQRNRHMFKEHNVAAATYKCNICDKSFILKSKLTSHIKKVHLMERNHICSECGQGFFIKQSLDEHMVKHNGERVFSCTVCHKAYARKKTLREHMRIHNNDRRFKCGVCSVAFVQKCSLKSHMLTNHGISLSEFENKRSNIYCQTIL
ncbi:zinc finger protein 62-like [Melitaea cinxia]|uniref:zinc finger protein 62-like n=1 Tax=Melitaea cinxia TaxID=113334 RepID=UPI001E26F004|nr:zinc finger protein 62-like [Melitaea cinxia]